MVTQNSAADHWAVSSFLENGCKYRYGMSCLTIGDDQLMPNAKRLARSIVVAAHELNLTNTHHTTSSTHHSDCWRVLTTKQRSMAAEPLLAMLTDSP